MKAVCRILMTLPIVLCLTAPAVAAQEKGEGAADENAVRAASRTTAAWTLRQDMRKLWTDHVVWTRDYIIAAVADHPDQEAAANRLMKNQEDIGKAVGHYYGGEAGDRLTTLLKEHITIAVDVVKAAKADDKARLEAADTKWQQNADNIATMLSRANPNWPKGALTDLLKKHLTTTTDEVKARLQKDWEADVKAFDAVYEHSLKMADALSDGIIKQYPTRFRESTAASY